MNAPVSRRTILTGAAAAAITVPVAVTLASKSLTPAATPAGSNFPVPQGSPLGAYIEIDAQDNVTVFIGSTEMGQGILSGLAQLVAEELQLSWSQVRTAQPDAWTGAAPDPYANPMFGARVTGGSTSMRGWYLPIRQAAAIAGLWLRQGAAAQTNTAVSAWSLAPGGKLTNGSQTLTFSQVVASAAATPMPTSPPPLATTNAVVGQRVLRTDLPSKVNGSAVFGIDVQVPGMVYASVFHCPTLGGVVSSMPSKLSGALAVVNLNTAVAAVANDTWSAVRLAQSLGGSTKWTLPASLASRDTASVAAQGAALLTSTTATAQVYETTGTVDPSVALQSAATKIDATYTLPFLAHGCMEVLNCTASVTATSAEIWAPTQGQAFCLPTVMAVTGLPASAIKIHTTYLGGGLGRKIEQDYIFQAVTIAKQIGKPVKLVWSRTQDFQNDKYRPSAQIRVQAGLDASKGVSALLYRNVSPSINVQRNTVPGNNPEDTGAVAGALGLPYAIVNRRIEFIPNLTDIPLGYWRSVGESYNTFAVESAIDELALAAGLDPMAFRKTLAAGDSRALGVLNAVDALSGWSTTKASSGSALGMAFLKGFGSYIALVVQVSGTSPTAIRVSKAYCAIDCGAAINPDSIEAQVMGGIAHGLSAALWGQVTFVNGVTNVKNFSNYRMARMGDMPQVSVKIVPSTQSPGGVGETGVPCVAPAIANAYARLTGTRVRTLPFAPGATMGDG